jgi:hypothetical protein
MNCSLMSDTKVPPKEMLCGRIDAFFFAKKTSEPLIWNEFDIFINGLNRKNISIYYFNEK